MGKLSEYDDVEREVTLGRKAESQTPEPQAVAWRKPYPGGPPWHSFSQTIQDGEPLCSLPAAQALLAQRDERIAALEADLEQQRVERIAAQGIAADLETELAELRPVARAAVAYAKERRDRKHGAIPNMEAPLLNAIVLAADALTPETRSKLLKEE